MKSLRLLLWDLPEYVRLSKAVESERQTVLRAVSGKAVFIFGAGRRGREMTDLMRRAGIEPMSMCDNNKELWGSEVAGIMVQSPEDCVSQCTLCDGVFVVANKLNKANIADQLLQMGVPSSQIVKAK